MSQSKRSFQSLEYWTTEFCCGNRIYQDLDSLFDFSNLTAWPDALWLNQCLPNQVTTQSGFKVQFVAQHQDFDFGGLYYEAVIYKTGQVPTRIDNWHDLFGAFIWCLLPKTKALLNQLHYQDIEKCGLKTRTRVRNAITLLDECGVILATSDLRFRTALREHQWHWAFVENRAS